MAIYSTEKINKLVIGLFSLSFTAAVTMAELLD
jgi:hypothetical protein